MIVTQNAIQSAAAEAAQRRKLPYEKRRMPAAVAVSEAMLICQNEVKIALAPRAARRVRALSRDSRSP